MCAAGLWALACAALLSACTGKIGDATPSGAGAGGPGSNGPGSGAAQPFTAFETLSRRLSQAEIDATIRDLFGDETAPATRFIVGDQFAPYDDDETLQEASSALIESLEVMADDVGARLVGDSVRRARIVLCTPSGPGDAACFRQFVTTLGKRALRRPLSDDEIASYMRLQSYATETNAYVQNDFFTAVGLVVEALLQDPEFLYRIEAGTATKDPNVFLLSNHEIAARLSYLLLGTTPDDALLADADAGRLIDGPGRRAVAERVLSDARAKVQMHRFHAMWLGYRAIPQPPELVAAFERETSALIDRVIFDKKESYMQLFLERETYLDNLLADHYQLPRPPSGQDWVSYQGTERAGILSHGSVLAAFSKFTDTSPTQRGILVRSRLMCQTIAPPPPTVNVDRPPMDSNAVCKKDRYLAHSQSPSCHACHSQMDPIGFGLENYDIAGVFRTHDDGHPECAIDGQGELPGFGTFSGPRELAEKLVSNDIVGPCAVRQYLTFAVGHAPKGNELDAIKGYAARFAQNDHAFDRLILDFVESDAFALRKEPEVMP